jgi:hypothetical protein
MLTGAAKASATDEIVTVVLRARHDRDERLAAERIRGVGNALLNRIFPRTFPLDEDGARWRSYGLLAMARRVPEAGGVRTVGLSQLDIAATALGLRGDGFQTISDFPTALLSVARVRA